MQQADGTTTSPGSDTAPAPSRRYLALLVALVGLLLPLGYAAHSGHVWEDYLITYRHSQNLAEGNGLVFTPGERVHGFTSPINTLLPAGFAYLIGPQHWESVLWAYRICSAVALAAAAYLGVRMVQRFGSNAGWDSTLKHVVAVLAGLWVLTDFKTLAFSANGQEAAFLALFGLLMLHTITRPLDELNRRGWIVLGIAWAGYQYTRPDSFIYCATGLLLLLVAERFRRSVFVVALRAGLLSLALYLPWTLWTWWYYGTPVPHTITAKDGYVDRGWAIGSVVERLSDQIWWTLQRINDTIYGGGSMGFWLVTTGGLISIFAMTVCLWPRAGRLARTASVLTVVAIIYVTLLPRQFPWYLVNASVFMPIALAAVIGALGHRLSRVADVASPRKISIGSNIWLVVAIFALIISIQRGVVLQRSFVVWPIQQELIENRVRRPIGEWLRENARPTDRVYIECLGYVGFFSRLNMLDWPGLCSPAVVEMRKRIGRSDFALTGLLLEPEWIVLRESEIKDFLIYEEFHRDYQPVKTFDVTAEYDRYAAPTPTRPVGVHGITLLRFDKKFTIFKRISPASDPRSPSTNPPDSAPAGPTPSPAS